MKKILTAVIAFTTLPVSATVTFEIQFGIAFDVFGTEVPVNTLWALAVDTNEDNQFAGFGLDQNLTTTATADLYFDPNTSLALGDSINGDTVFAMGGFNEAGDGTVGGHISTISDWTYGTYDTVAGRNFVFYWFPGAEYTGGLSEMIEEQVGGINASVNDASGFLFAMILPDENNGTPAKPLGTATADFDGSRTNAQFTAVALTVPEPSAAMLWALAGIGLVLRRRR